MNLRLEDSLSGEPTAVPRTARRTLALYVCGPTVYDAAHVGHGRTYLFFDIARRFLEAEGFRVRHVMNVTDIEEKIDRRAAALGVTWRQLARREERAFFRDIAEFGLLPPTLRPRTSDYVSHMAQVARALEKTGRVRRSDHEWIYEAPERPSRENFPTGADLAAHAVAEPSHPFRAGDGDPRSFVIWKLQEKPLPSWPGPWGRGVPGWHLECFALTSHLLGIPVDLHGGARDLIYPHHYAENEIALTLEGHRFSRLFLHTGLVLQNGTKMSKSVGNLIPLRTALAAVGPGALRWYFAGRHYTERVEWDAGALARAREEYEMVRRIVLAWLVPGSGGRVGAAVAEALEERTRRDLAHGLRTDHAVERIRRFAEALARDPSGRVARGERTRARASIARIEARTGIPLL
jgi:cysteinyl-tRNA synthetase